MSLLPGAFFCFKKNLNAALFMNTSRTLRSDRDRLIRGGAALAGTATAALAAPVTVVLETPMVTDATATTVAPQIYALNIFSGQSIGLNADEEPPFDIGQPGTLIFGTVGVLDGAAEGGMKPVFAPIVAGSSGIIDDTPFGTTFATVDGSKLSIVIPVGSTTEISQSLFDLAPAIGEGGLAGAPYILTPDDAETYNTWLEGESAQFYIPFNAISGATAHYGYLELAYDAPSVSLALLSYGYDDEGNPITTPSEFTPYTPPEDFVMTPIPEPASCATGAALLAGSVALFRRRRATVAA